MNEKKPKNNFNEELNVLFEKLVEAKDQKLKNIEDIKKRITIRLDGEISRLYAKKDFIADIWDRRAELRLQKVSVIRKIMRNSIMMNLRCLVSMPFIYAMIFPALFLHIMVEVYQQVCFRLYVIPRVRAREYFIFDRRLLPYLNWFEKINCFYCSYFNCLISFVKEIGGRTERYWCPIKHSKTVKDQHSTYDDFVDYSDGEELRKRWNKLRKFD